MLYSDLIRQEGEYNYSVNIQYDMDDDKKLLRFIPNETTVALLKEYFSDITRQNSSNHSRILYGSYGTGKSHFLTVLSMLLEKLHTKEIAYRSFSDRIKEYDEGLSYDIDKYVNDESRRPFLIVPIVFDFDDFDRCIYFSLKKKLDSVGVKISFKTFYDQAQNLLNQWSANEESFVRLKESCIKYNITPEKLSEKLTLLDASSEGIFQNVFSAMTFGVKYIYEVSNLSDTINQTNEVLKDKYEGIVFIFDEFGRYLEDNIKKIKVKSVQDLAEYCDHSNGNNHVILVSHKEIGQYTQKFGKLISSEWKKVEGRFNATPVNDKQDQCLSLIRNILNKDVAIWEQFQDTFKDELNNIYSEGLDFKGFLVDVQKENPFEAGFPLHPISLYALDKLSKKVAQNERTFFTYLASKDDNSLYRFLQSNNLNEFHFVGIDQIFDYFEPSIKAVQSDDCYEWYKNLQTAISKCGLDSSSDSPEIRILKVISVIGIINDSNALIANKRTLTSVIDCPKDILENAIIGLSERRIIKYSGTYDRYVFFEASIFDIESMINEECLRVKDEVVINTLNEEFIDFILYPYQYNRKYKISRVFIPAYSMMSIASLTQRALSNLLGPYYDGALIMMLGNDDTDIESIKQLSKALQRTIIFLNRESQSLCLSVKQYIAVKYLESQKAVYQKKDPLFEKEIDYFKKEIINTIYRLINEWKCNYQNETTIVVNAEICSNISSFSELSNLASRVSEDAFRNTLIVNNELINKNSIYGSIASAKKNVITNIIKGEVASEYYNTSKLSPDYIAVRSVLVKNGFVSGIDNVEQNALPDNSQPQQEVQKVIVKYIKKAKHESFLLSEMISELKSPPFGLRNGYLSLLLAHAFVPYKKSLIISSHDVEQEITADLFEELVRRPADYSITITSWTKEQNEYLDSLEQVFSDFISENTLGKNRLKAIYDAMLSHYKNVSKFSRTTSVYISEETALYRKLLEKSTTNYSTFFFKKLKEYGNTFINTVSMVKKSKYELENALTHLAVDLSESLYKVFSMPKNILLGKALSDKYSSEWNLKHKKSFDYYTNSFLDFAKNIIEAESDYEVIVKLSKILTGFEIVYWNDTHKNEFMERLREIKEKIESYIISDSLSGHEAKVSITTASGNEKSIVFDKTGLNTISKTALNKIKSSLENYGLAISYDDKIQIVLSLLDDLTEGK